LNEEGSVDQDNVGWRFDFEISKKRICSKKSESFIQNISAVTWIFTFYKLQLGAGPRIVVLRGKSGIDLTRRTLLSIVELYAGIFSFVHGARLISTVRF